MEDTYFKHYESLEIQSKMIGDRIRTNSYKSAIFKNLENIRDKVVLDVGAGTGILSLFCAQAGAKRVYAIEASNMAEHARIFIKDNSYDQVVTVIEDKVENIKLPEKVDVIVSEWMGITLLVENMLPSVLFARDNFLKTGGLILPEVAEMYIAPISHSYVNDNKQYWDDLSDTYGLKLKSLEKEVFAHYTKFIKVKVANKEDILSDASKLVTFDLNKMKSSELDKINSQFDCLCYGHNSLDGFVIWFDVHFPGDVSLSTSPYEEPTHWLQTILPLSNSLNVEQGTRISGLLTISRFGHGLRENSFKLDYKLNDDDFMNQIFVSTISKTSGGNR